MEGENSASMVCIHCGCSVTSVYVEYSPGNIRLSTCTRCQSPVDEYVEYEGMIILIDVILHKPKAYRHLFFNYLRPHQLKMQNLIWKAAALFLLLDTCRYASQGVGSEKIIHWDSLASFLLTAGKVVAQVAFLNGAFLFVLTLVSQGWPRKEPNLNLKLMDIILAILLSSHLKFFVLAMMVWEFSPLMGFMVDMLVLSSNTVALKVMLNTSTIHAAAAVIGGGVVKLMMGTLLPVYVGSLQVRRLYT